jgi:hypothetical protein
VVASDNHAAAAGRLLRVDAVLGADAGLVAGLAQGLGILVVADAAQVDGALRWEDVLGATGGVLGGAAGDQDGLVVVEQVLVDRLVAVLGEDSVVLLEVVLVKESLVALCLDIWWGKLATGAGMWQSQE